MNENGKKLAAEEAEGINFSHDGDFYFFYAHLNNIYVKAGEVFTAGQQIGLSGCSGNAPNTKSPHLHFEVVAQKN